ncbi:MAG: tail fiber domain-containing protein [Phycisphaerae bacterium]
MTAGDGITVNSGVVSLDTSYTDGRYWRLGGNTGSSTQTLGTLGNNPLEFIVNSQRSMRIEPNATSPNLIGGYSGNSVTSGVVGATIGGGGKSGGTNRVTDEYGTIAGGWANEASYRATIGGGSGNTASGERSTVAGGSGNSASGPLSSIGGGSSNVASGEQAIIPGGFNCIAGFRAFAAGNHAHAIHDGAFVWADSNDGTVVESTAADQFVARAAGGFHFFTDYLMNTGARLSSGSGAWSAMSDRNAKENFKPVDPNDVLDRLVAIPLETWNYKSQDPSIRHIGPMAQDFHAAFGVGEDDRHITTIDADGVALAAIQGLYQIVKTKDRLIDAQERRLEDLEARFRALETHLNMRKRSTGLAR